MFLGQWLGRGSRLIVAGRKYHLTRSNAKWLDRTDGEMDRQGRILAYSRRVWRTWGYQVRIQRNLWIEPPPFRERSERGTRTSLGFCTLCQKFVQKWWRF